MEEAKTNMSELLKRIRCKLSGVSVEIGNDCKVLIFAVLVGGGLTDRERKDQT